MKNISKEELNEILKKHKMWLNGEVGGERADLRGADLRSIHLRFADLRFADLRGADLRGTDLRGTDLRSIETNMSTIGYNLACPEKGSFIGYKKEEYYEGKEEVWKSS